MSESSTCAIVAEEASPVARRTITTSLAEHLTAAVTLGFGSEPCEEEFVPQATHEHQALVEHVARGDADAAGRCAQAHFAITLETMRASLRRASRG